MSGDTAGAIPKARRNKNKNSAKKNKNKNQTMNFVTGIAAGTSAEPGSWEYPPGTADSALVVPVHTPLKQTKSKKRNNSVSAIDQGDGVAPKKTKHDDIPVPKNHESRIFRNSRMKKYKKNRVFKDHMDDEDMEAPASTSPSVAVLKKLLCETLKAKPTADEDMQSNVARTAETKTDGTNNNQPKKQRKRKRQKKHAKMDTDEEPNLKIQKHSTSEDELTEVMDSMQIDTDPSSLSNLLDEMVPDGPKPCKPKREKVSHNKNMNTDAFKFSNEFDLKKVVKWTKKNWKRDRVSATTVENQNSSVLIENLPVVTSSVYRKKLMEVFQKYGQIKNIGPAQMQLCDEGEPTFNTTICFDSEDAAIKALDEDNSHFAGTVVRVRRPFPVVELPSNGYCHYNRASLRTHYNLPIENLRSIFGGSGPSARVVATRRDSGTGELLCC